MHRWRYRVEFKNRPPSGSFMGLLTAQSPWDPSETLSMNVVGQLRTGPQAFPQSIVLDPSNGRPVSLLVVCASARGTLDVVREGAEAAPLIVEEEGGEEKGEYTGSPSRFGRALYKIVQRSEPRSRSVSAKPRRSCPCRLGSELSRRA